MKRPQTNNVVVIWIDWYAYHVARFRALADHATLRGRMRGVELVGGAGVHQGFVFREKASDLLPVTTLAPDQNWSDAGQFSLARRVWRKLNELDPAAVLVPGYYTLPALAAALWSKLHGRRSVLMTESTQADHARTGWREALKSALLQSLFDWAVAGGSAHVRYLEALKFPLERVALNYDVVDNTFFAAVADDVRRNKDRSEWDLPSDYFLYVGRLAPEKNVHGLLEEFAAYRSRGGKWRLVLAGDGPLRADLERLATYLEIRAFVHFAGHQNSSSLVPYYAFARCFVLPSSREPWGLVVNEAMAAGLPVVVSNRCGCAEDLVHEGVNGFTIDPSQPGELEAALSRMEWSGAEQLVKMGRCSRDIIGRFSPKTWADEVARVLAA